jgi:hypothetical protein
MACCMDPMDCFCWNSSASVSYGCTLDTGHVMCSCTHLDASLISNTRKTAWNWPISPYRKHGNAVTVFDLLHGSNGLFLLKLISRISLLWIHTAHVMCSWTHLYAFSSQPHTQNSLELAHQPIQHFKPVMLIHVWFT